MIIVNRVMPSANTSTVRKMLPFGMTDCGQLADDVADARGREQHAERGEHLRKHGRPADRIDQPAAFLQRRDRRRPEPGEDGGEREQDAEAEEDVGLALRLDPAEAADRRVIVDERSRRARWRG